MESYFELQSHQKTKPHYYQLLGGINRAFFWQNAAVGQTSIESTWSYMKLHEVTWSYMKVQPFILCKYSEHAIFRAPSNKTVWSIDNKVVFKVKQRKSTPYKLKLIVQIELISKPILWLRPKINLACVRAATECSTESPID